MGVVVCPFSSHDGSDIDMRLVLFIDLICTQTWILISALHVHSKDYYNMHLLFFLYWKINIIFGKLTIITMVNWTYFYKFCFKKIIKIIQLITDNNRLETVYWLPLNSIECLNISMECFNVIQPVKLLASYFKWSRLLRALKIKWKRTQEEREFGTHCSSRWSKHS